MTIAPLSDLAVLPGLSPVQMIGIPLALVGAVALITLTYSWPAVGGWFAAQGVVGGFAWGLIPVAVAAVTGFFILRRATPRN